MGPDETSERVPKALNVFKFIMGGLEWSFVQFSYECQVRISEIT